jgi:phosphatidyl-myo-inositol dimannoside synthase
MLENVVQGLLDRHHSVEVLTFGEPYNDGCTAFDARQNYTIHRIAASAQRGKEILIMAARLFSLTFHKRYDAILCGVAWSSGVICILPRLLRGVPFVVYTHGEDTTVVKGSRWKEALLKASFARASSILTNSNFSKNAVDEMGAPIGKCEVLYPTIDPNPYASVSDTQARELTSRLGLQGRCLLLTVARLQKRKGHDTVVRCLPSLANQFENIHYIILGKGDRTDITNLAKNLGVVDRLTIIDYLDEQDLPVLYRAVDVYVMVSRWDSDAQEVEGFGMTYLEAAAAGRPSVAGNQGGAVTHCSRLY